MNGNTRNSIIIFFFQAEDGIRELVRSRGLGDVYKRQHQWLQSFIKSGLQNVTLVLAGRDRVYDEPEGERFFGRIKQAIEKAVSDGVPVELVDIDLKPLSDCLLYTSDAADERSRVDLGGGRIIKKKKRWKKSRPRHNEKEKRDNTRA